MEDFPSTRPHYRKLPAEMNREIYLCFNSTTQRKFICGLGWDFYAMFRQKLLTKTKRVCNPDRNGWNRATTRATVSSDGLRACSSDIMTYIYAEKGFPISGKHYRVDSFPGTIIYYYEVKLLYKSYSFCRIGISNENPTADWIGDYPNSYAISTGFNFCCLSGETHIFELPEGAIKPKSNENGTNVYGCGLVMDPKDKLAIFFTSNGTLMGRQIQISPFVDDYLFPAITLLYTVYSIEANFGDEKDKPFVYDIKKCPGMGLEWI